MSGFYTNPSGQIEYVEGDVKGAFPGDPDERDLYQCDECLRWQRMEPVCIRIDHEVLTLKYCDRCAAEYTEVCSGCSTTFQIDDLELDDDHDNPEPTWICEACKSNRPRS